MAKVGRNERCPCGSGKKLKRCCVEQVARIERLEVERARLEAESKRRTAEHERLKAEHERLTAERVVLFEEVDEVDRDSTGVLRLIKAGQIEEAEATARRLVADSPEATVAIERLGQVYEAKGQPRAAADEYRGVVARMDARGAGHFCDCCRARMVKAIRRLDPDRPAPALGRDPR